MKKEPKIIDITDKKSITCPSCDLLIDIPPRMISMEKLKHMQGVKEFGEWHKKHIKTQGIGNARCLIICPKCEQIMICTDQLSFQI